MPNGVPFPIFYTVFSDDMQTVRYANAANTAYDLNTVITAALEEAKATVKVVTVLIGFTDPQNFEGEKIEEEKQDGEGPVQE